MSNRIFQSVMSQLNEATGRTVGVIDTTGVIISCSDLGKIGDLVQLPENVFTSSSVVCSAVYSFISFGVKAEKDFAVFIDGTDEGAENCLNIVCIALSSIKQCYDEKYDRSIFVKNVILDNILPGDIYLKARELHFNNDTSRAVFLFKLKTRDDASVIEMMQTIFPDRSKDFVINVNESDVALVKEVNANVETKDLEKLARSVIDSLGSEYYSSHAIVGIGTVVAGCKDLARSFKEAQVAIEVGKFFDTEKTIITYENLGIARLIYQLPTTLCDMFLREIFKRGSIESLDAETLFTIQKFFENNLNVSETSRKLFVHRNTLVYRLEKIKKLTGLDLREFDDAIVFKVALMVKKYLDANPVKY